MFGGTGGELTPWGRKALTQYKDQISMVNVTSAEGSESDNGHGYFRHSPWVSSDILMTLYYGLSPKERGLVGEKDLPMYTFPSNFIQRLWSAIKKVDPKFAAEYKKLQDRQSM